MKLTDFEAVLFDMDGTLYRAEHALPGSAEVIAYLSKAAIPIACLTNNSANTTAQLSQRLARMNIIVPEKSIYTACQAMADWIRTRWARPRIFNFAGDALSLELRDSAMFVQRADEPCDVVTVGSHMRENDIGFQMDRALIALTQLRRGADLLIGCADRVFPTPEGVEFGSGSWGALFNFGANVPPQRIHYAGKPEPEFFLHLCQRLGVAPSRCLLIGDNLESDIGGGLAVGMTTVLLLSGVTTKAESQSSRVRPHLIFEDLNELLAAMIKTGSDPVSIPTTQV